jgi:hypothetical protein
MSRLSDIKPLVKELLEAMEVEEEDTDPWNDKADAFDFLHKYHEKMKNLLEEVLSIAE